MIIVSNTSPVMNLAAIGRLDVLKELYGNVFIPEAVLAELSAIDGGKFNIPSVQEFQWIKIAAVLDRPLVSSLMLELDFGEAEAIALAIEMKSGLLLIDERIGRKTAARLGLRFIGLLGILIDAKRHGLITELKPVLDALVSKAGFWVSGQLYTRALETAGE